MTVTATRVARDKCGAKNRAGQPCQRPAGWGTESTTGRCKLHGGRTPSGKKYAITLSARQQLERLTREPLTPEQYVDPISALLEAVTEASMVVSYLREQVMLLDRDLAGDPTWTHMLTTTTRQGDVIELGEEARALVKLYGEWHDRKVAAAKACAAAKIDERVTRLAEAQGARLDAAFRIFCEQMGFTGERMLHARKVFAASFAELRGLPMKRDERDNGDTT